MVLKDLIVFDACQGHACVMEPFASRGEIQPWTGMRSLCGESHRDLISFRDHPFYSVLQIGKGGQELADEPLHALWLREEFCCQCKLLSIPHLVIDAAHQDFVLAG